MTGEKKGGGRQSGHLYLPPSLQPMGTKNVTVEKGEGENKSVFSTNSPRFRPGQGVKEGCLGPKKEKEK